MKISVYSRRRLSGRRNGTPCICSTTSWLETPMPSIMRPPEISSRVAYSSARTAGEREKTLTIVVPIWIREVFCAITASHGIAESCHASGTATSS